MARHKGSASASRQSKAPLTHFLCIPLVTPASRPQLDASVSRFRDEVAPAEAGTETDHEPTKPAAQSSSTLTVPLKAIRPVGSLHCTLGVMSLDQDRLSEATSFLHDHEVRELVERTTQAVSDDGEAPVSTLASTPPHPLMINLRGLVSMHAAKSTSILYAAPEDQTDRLYPFCVALQKLFKDKGFLVEDNRALKLHATVVNTIYAKGTKSPKGRDHGSGHGPNANAPLKIDATSLLEKYQDFVWAQDVVLDRIAICEMGVKKVFDTAEIETGSEYKEAATIALPEGSL